MAGVVEPIAAVGVVSKLISLALKGGAAAHASGLGKDDLEALQAALEAGQAVRAASAVAPEDAAHHLALIARCFGQAVARHQELHGLRTLRGGLRRWLDSDERARDREIKLRVQLALLEPARLGEHARGDVDAIAALTGSPLATPYYRRLWLAFSSPGLTLPGEDPPLDMSRAARREFERYFLLAYLPALESPAGKAVRGYLDRLEDYRAHRIQDLLLQDLASWGARHVFGNVPRARWSDDEPVPFLALDDLFVECDGAIAAADGPASTPLLGAIEALVAADAPPRVVVVVADFGSGKSMAARKLAARWAEAALASTAVGPDTVVPVYVKCAEDFSSDAVDLPTTLRRAWRRQAEGFGLGLDLDDPGLAEPARDQRTVVLLDGLDEVALGDQALRTLFQRLRDRTTERRRFVVFSRPGAVPRRDELGERVVVVQVQPFTDAQIAAWIAGWNRARPGGPALARDELEARGLAEVIRTPILLFMAAFTAAPEVERTTAASLAELYEGFFAQIATGKAKADRERHGPIARASDALLMALRRAGLLDEADEPADAMLWLMGRVAWEAQRLEERAPPEALRQRHVESVLAEARLGVGPEALHAIEVGLVLALQSDLRAANHPILFGHQSFREFLVGRHWAMTLARALGERSDRRRDEVVRELYGGRLLAEQSRAYDFLMQLVNAPVAPARPRSACQWTDERRRALVGWAQEAFEDDAQWFASPERMAIADDRRAVVREAALAIGSRTRGSPGLRARDARSLRSLLAWFQATGQTARLIADGADLAGLDLSHQAVSGACFAGAHMDGVTVQGGTLVRCELAGAHLAGADFSLCLLELSSFRGAILDGARMMGARGRSVGFPAATARAARFVDARLPDVGFEAAQLQGADFSLANLSYGRFEMADLTAVRMHRANLTWATLRDARLVGVDLRAADLRSARLYGADLDGARLDDADLRSARYDARTRWPTGFDPRAAGAVEDPVGMAPDTPDDAAPDLAPRSSFPAAPRPR